MAKSFDVEKEWTTEAGLPAVVIRGRHRCGYVAVKEGHPAFGKAYDEQLPCITKEKIEQASTEKLSPVQIFTATLLSDKEGEEIRRSLDLLMNVHGGLTYSSKYKNAAYPVFIEGAWWLGFDAGHYGDDSPGGQSLEYMMAECESLAQQLQALVKENSDGLIQDC